MRIAEVAEQKQTATVDVQLRVYELTKDFSLASGTVTPEQAKQLKVGEPIVILTRDGRSITGKITVLNDQLQRATGVLLQLKTPVWLSSLRTDAPSKGTVDRHQ